MKLRRTPDVNNQCASCHATPIGEEFKGLRAEARSDVHFAWQA